MSTTPPEQPTTPQQPGGGYGSGGPNVNFNLSALMPTPGNAELVVYILATIVVGIITLSDGRVDAPEFVTAFTFITIAYISLEGLQASTSRPESEFCRACLTRDYPTAIPREAAKLQFEPV